MLVFLSDEWVAALDEVASADPALRQATTEVALLVEQEVTDGPEGPRTFHLRFDHGRASVGLGPGPDDELPRVRFRQEYATAVAIASGIGSAQRAFMAGDLHVGGDLRILLEHQAVLAAMGDVFAAVRDRTDLPTPTDTDAG